MDVCGGRSKKERQKRKLDDKRGDSHISFTKQKIKGCIGLPSAIETERICGKYYILLTI